MTAWLALGGLVLLWAAYWLGYQMGYKTHRLEEENKAAARAARLREFTAKGRAEDGEWFKAKQRS